VSPLTAVGFIAFFFAALAVGIRLLALWWRTGELPALLIAIGVLGIGPVGFGSSVLGGLVRDSAPVAASSLAALGTITVFLGVFAKFVFNWRVYHPDSKAARAVVATGALVLLGMLVYRLAVRGFDDTRLPSALSLLQSAVQVSALLWGSAEAFRYWLRMRRRAVLGLADPVVVNRFALWSLGAGAAGVGSAVGAVAGYVTGGSTLEMGWVIASSSAHGFVAAVAMFLAFVPPRRYLAWVRSQADA